MDPRRGSICGDSEFVPHPRAREHLTSRAPEGAEPATLARIAYDKIARVYDLLGCFYTGGQIARLKLRQSATLEPNTRVLYAGIGTGEELASALAVGAQPTALDTSSVMLERARLRVGGGAEHVRFCCEDFFAHQAPEPYDTVVANFFLNVFAESMLPLCLTRLNQLVRPGGTLLIGDFAPPVDHPVERILQRAYYLAPLALFRLLTQNPWHRLYDYRPIAERCGFRLCAHERVRIFRFGPRWLSTLRFVKAADAE